jgi:hypothetical protein
MSNRKLNSYDVLMWWGKVLNSCNTEDQFKNALNLWPKVIELTPCVSDAWMEIVNTAKVKLGRIVVPLKVTKVNQNLTTIEWEYPKTAIEVKRAVFGQLIPPGVE